jgi:hypothetical protein
LQAEEIRKEP